MRLWLFPDRGSSPGDQAVTEEFRLDWDSVLVGSEQVIVARLDGRGSGFRGQRYCSYILITVSVIEYTQKVGPQHVQV